MHAKSIILTPEIEAYFWARVARSDDSTACWEWQAARLANGYGRLCLPSGQYLAHRVAYLIANGSLPNDLLVCHHCDNRPCCNPFHLFLGTVKDNAQDMSRKGRAGARDLRGSTIGNAVLTEEKVAQLLAQRRQSGTSLAELAEQFGTSKSNVSLIVRGLAWQHVPR